MNKWKIRKIIGLLYKIDVLDYQKQKGTPMGAHIDRVGQVFYQA